MVKQRAIKGVQARASARQASNKLIRAAQKVQSAAQATQKINDPLEGMRTRVKISDCAAGFAIANRNPFLAYEKNIPPVCMPDNIVLPTAKIRVVGKGSASTGTTGVGFAGLAPNVVTSDGIAVQTTTSASVLTTATTPNATTNKSGVVYSTSRFANAAIGAGLVEYRVCAAGLRVRYAGTQLNMGGTVYAYRAPSNSNLELTALSSWINLPETRKFPFTREWVNLRWKISDPAEQNFDTTTAPTYCMYIAIVAATGDAQPFEVEAVNFHELVGANTGAKTVSHSDPVGFGAVQAISTASADANKGQGDSGKNILTNVAKAIQTASSHVQTGVQAAKMGKDVIDAGSEIYRVGAQIANLLKGAEGMAGMAEEFGGMALMAL